VTTYKSIRNLSACVEKRGELGWVVGYSLGGERWDGEENGEEEGETEEERKRVSAESLCTGFYRWNHRRKPSIGDSASGSDTSLNGYPGLNPSVFPSVNSSEKIHVITPLQLSKKGFSTVGDTVGIYRWTNSVGIYRRYHRRNVSVGKYRQSLRRN